MWSPGSVLDDGLAVGGSVTTIRFSPDGSKLAVAWEDEGRGGVTIVEVEPNGFGATWDIPQPRGRRYSLPTWLDDSRIGVLDLAVGRDGPGTLLTVDAVSGNVISSLILDDEVVDVDYAAGGATVLVVTLKGQIKWVVAGASGVLIDGYHQAARW